MKRILSKRRSKIVLLGTIVVATAAALTVLVASTAAQPRQQKVVGMSLGFLNNPAIAVQVSTTQRLAKQKGIKLLSPTDAAGDGAKQVGDIRNLISSGAKGLIVIVADSDAIVPALNYAASKRVPVVSIDIGPNGGSWYMLVKADNKLMGNSGCKAMAKAVGGSGTVLNVQGDLTTINGRDRTNGFTACMKKLYPRIKVVTKPAGSWKPEDFFAVVKTGLGSIPDLKGIYLPSDAVGLQGTLNILKTAGKLKKVGQSGHIALVTIDGTPFSLKNIRSGYVDAVISQPITDYAKLGIRYISDALDGKQYKPGKTDHKSVIRRGKGGLVDFLPSPTVTRTNARDGNLWGNQVK